MKKLLTWIKTEKSWAGWKLWTEVKNDFVYVRMFKLLTRIIINIWSNFELSKSGTWNKIFIFYCYLLKDLLFYTERNVSNYLLGIKNKFYRLIRIKNVSLFQYNLYNFSLDMRTGHYRFLFSRTFLNSTYKNILNFSGLKIEILT